MSSYSDSRQEPLRGIMGPRHESNAQLMIQKDTLSGEKIRNALLMK
jgi:hypothetical protein